MQVLHLRLLMTIIGYFIPDDCNRPPKGQGALPDIHSTYQTAIVSKNSKEQCCHQRERTEDLNSFYGLTEYC